MSKTLNAGKIPAFTLFLLLMLTTASAYTNYTSVGGEDNYYRGSTTLFNNENLDYQIQTKSISDPKMTPFVADLDGDGKQEIITIGSNTLRLYHYYSSNNTMDQVDSLTLPSGEYNTLDIIDIDGDGYKEIITANELVAKTNLNITIAEYNGTSFNTQTTFLNQLQYGGSNANAIFMLKCGAENECFITGTAGHVCVGGTQTQGYYMVGMFNQTEFTNTTVLDNTSMLGCNSYDNYYFPSTRSAGYEDYDKDGDNDYVWTVLRTWNGRQTPSPTAGTEYYLYSFDESFNYVEGTFDGDDTLNGAGRFTNYSFLLTNPLVYDFDTGGNDEIAVASSDSADVFSIKLHEADFSELDTYPEIQTADGLIISDVFLAYGMPDDPNSACVVGYNSDENLIDVLCGSEQTSMLIETREYTCDLPYDVQYDANSFYTNIAHSIRASADTSESTITGENYDEVTTSYGTVKLTDHNGNLGLGGCLLFGDCNCSIIWTNPRVNASVIPLDYELQDQSDYLMYTESNLWYFDDKLTNSVPYIYSYTVNPCIDSVWQVNTTVQITVQPRDDDSDTVRARVFLYDSQDYQQDSNWTSFLASGTTFTFSFKANTTGTNEQIRLMIQDSENNDTNISTLLPFTVANNGVEFGACETSFTNTTPVVDNDTITDVNGDTFEQNVVTTSMRQMDNLGFQIGLTAMWLMFMIGMAVIIFFTAYEYLGMHTGTDVKLVVGLISFVEFMMLLLGYYLSVISLGLVISVVIVALFIVVMLFIRPLLVGTGG